MARKPAFAVTVTSSILLLYCILIAGNSPLAYIIFSISPFLIIWTAYSIIRYGIFSSRELKKDEEWGYDDKSKEELGTL